MTRRSLLQAVCAVVGLGATVKASDDTGIARFDGTTAVPAVDERLVLFDTVYPCHGCYVFPQQRQCNITWRSDGHLMSAVVTDYRRYISVHREVLPDLGVGAMVVNVISTCDPAVEAGPAHWIRVGLVLVPQGKG